MAGQTELEKRFEELMAVVTEERQLRKKAEADLAATKQAAEAAAQVANANAIAIAAASAPKGPKMGLPFKGRVCDMRVTV
ncbi:hypothetical protein KEM48_011138 [Puccinia striiformis f. sp. tritici PST-130]|nr:hypothetical protein KEM48_011138 [Puccinia striiformis f. sp. tritici PST-130]